VSFLEQSGEKVLPLSARLQSLSPVMEQGVRTGRLDDMSRVARISSTVAKRNYFAVKEILAKYAVMIQDEFAETMFSFMWDSGAKLPSTRVIITDYVRFESRGRFNPLSKITLWYANRMLSKAFANSSLRIFADDLDAIPPSMRGKVRESFELVGPIVQDAPQQTKEELKRKILEKFWGDQVPSKRLIVVSIGGTSIGKYLVDFMYENSEEISGKLESQLLILLGPRIQAMGYLSSNSSKMKFVAFSVASMEFFKASDCVVSQAGASTLNEVASLGIPCVVTPIENHFEQETNARRFSEKYGFVVLKYRDLSINSFVASVTEVLDKSYDPPISNDGANKAASLILNLISERKK
jgi:UDP:flavonoid glycosyltransferase YjiC (YdhE family)